MDVCQSRESCSQCFAKSSFSSSRAEVLHASRRSRSTVNATRKRYEPPKQGVVSAVYYSTSGRGVLGRCGWCFRVSQLRCYGHRES